MSSVRSFITSAALLAACQVLLPITLALPEQAAAAALKPFKNSASLRRQSTSSANSARNSAARASRAASGRTATKTGGSESGSAPAEWRRTPPPMPADRRNAIAADVALKPFPVKLPGRQPGELSLSRHLTRVSEPKGLGKVVETKPLTQAERDFATGKGYSTLYSTQLSRLDHYPGSRNGFIGRQRLHSELRRKTNTAKAESRAVSNRSATTVTHNTGQQQTEAPANWRQPPPPMPADLRRGIAAGVALKPFPVKLPGRQPGELSLSRHLTRVSVPKGLGNVVETKPLTQAERDFATGKGYSTLYATQLRKLDHFLAERGASMSRYRLQSEFTAMVNTAKAQARAANGRSAKSVQGDASQSGTASLSGWRRPISFTASGSAGTVVQLKSTPAPLIDTWTSPPKLRISSHRTQPATSTSSDI